MKPKRSSIAEWGLRNALDDFPTLMLEQVYPSGNEVRFGMNVEGNDNPNFVLNVLHWLSGLLM